MKVTSTLTDEELGAFIFPESVNQFRARELANAAAEHEREKIINWLNSLNEIVTPKHAAVLLDTVMR